MTATTKTTITNRYPVDGFDSPRSYTFRSVLEIAGRKATNNGSRYAVSMSNAHGGRFYTVSRIEMPIEAEIKVTA